MKKVLQLIEGWTEDYLRLKKKKEVKGKERSSGIEIKLLNGKFIKK